MTSLTPRPNTTHFRRHSDPPKLWIWILAGSLTIHLAAWVAIQKKLAIAVIQADSTPIAVDFLEPIQESGIPPQDAKPNQIAEVSTQTKSPPAIAPVQSVTESSTTMPVSKAPIQTTSPKKTVIKESAPVPAISSTRLPNEPTVQNPTDIKQDSNDVTREPFAKLAPELPTGIASIAISSAPTPAQFVAQFWAIAPPSSPLNGSTESIPAQLLGESTKSFSSDPSVCSLTPEALRSFGQPVILNLSLDQTGALNSQNPTTVEQSSGNSHYDELVICVTTISRFSPAYLVEDNVKRAVSSDLKIRVSLSQ